MAYAEPPPVPRGMPKVRGARSKPAARSNRFAVPAEPLRAEPSELYLPDRAAQEVAEDDGNLQWTPEEEKLLAEAVRTVGR